MSENHKKTYPTDAYDCVCDTLLSIQHAQRKAKASKQAHNGYIPIMLQTPYGHPFMTFGSVGKDDCFVTVFFKVKAVDCKQQCATLILLRPNQSIINKETEDVEWQDICAVDYVTETDECITVKLDCYNAVKCLSPSFGISSEGYKMT
ncbi:CotY/CotZ family spore coat protein [Lentibacillus saliphilus]|uniref:CotY/CotZ family spore coat protein n=1 Tax=Lentibacillus saliphilus TaxID=2737028 RepID=UPI001C30FB6D